MVTKKTTVAAKGNKVETFTAKMMSAAERAAGIGIATLEDPNALGKADLIAALGWVYATKHEGYEGTYDEYSDTYTLAQITDSLGLNPDA